MRLPLARATLAAITIGALTACGAGAPSDSTAGAGDNGFPRTVEHAMGATKVPAAPKRVVALDDSFAEQTLMLDTEVVGYTDYRVGGGGLAGHLGRSREAFGASAVSVGPLTAPSLERVAALKPDLIVSAKVRHEKQYQQLSAIAPTVMSETTGQAWRENITLLARSLGKEDLAQQRMAEYTAQAQRIGKAIRDKAGPGTTVSIVRFVTNGPARLYARASFTGMVIADAGLARPQAQDVDKLMIEISPERIAMADGSRIFVATNGSGALASRAAFEQNPLWTPLLPKIVAVEDQEWISSVSVQGAYRILTDIAQAFDVPGPSVPGWITGK